MDYVGIRKLTGWLFVIAVIGFLITSTILGQAFEWPDILREDADTVLTKFDEGGTTLIRIRFSVAWSYFLLIFPVVLLRGVLEREEAPSPWLPVATTIGIISVAASLIGFSRWVFVVPNLVDLYTASGASEATRAGVVAAYTAQHQLAGTMLGEHVGQMLAVIWSAMISAGMLKSRLFSKWLGIFGFVASFAYLLTQGEILKTAMPDFPEVPLAGLLGSLLWAVWILAMGISLIRARPAGERLDVSREGVRA